MEVLYGSALATSLGQHMVGGRELKVAVGRLVVAMGESAFQFVGAMIPVAVWLVARFAHPRIGAVSPWQLSPGMLSAE